MIYTKSNALTPEICRELIEKFEKDERKYQGCVGGDKNKIIDHKVKKSTDLNIFPFREWNDIKSIIFEKMSFMIDDYLEYITKQMGFKELPNMPMYNYLHTPWCNIQRTDKDGHFNWHSDACFENSATYNIHFLFKHTR